MPDESLLNGPLMTWAYVSLIPLGLIPALIARSKGRSFLLWWVYGTVLWMFAFPHSLLLKRTAPPPTA